MAETKNIQWVYYTAGPTLAEKLNEAKKRLDAGFASFAKLVGMAPGPIVPLSGRGMARTPEEITEFGVKAINKLAAADWVEHMGGIYRARPGTEFSKAQKDALGKMCVMPDPDRLASALDSAGNEHNPPQLATVKLPSGQILTLEARLQEGIWNLRVPVNPRNNRSYKLPDSTLVESVEDRGRAARLFADAPDPFRPNPSAPQPAAPTPQAK